MAKLMMMCVHCVKQHWREHGSTSSLPENRAVVIVLYKGVSLCQEHFAALTEGGL